MPRRVQSTLAAFAFGLFALLALSGFARADTESDDYRIIGCIGPIEPPVEPFEPTYTVGFSSSPDELGQSCEDVFTALGSQGFRLIEVGEPENFLEGIPRLHYLERRRDD